MRRVLSLLTAVVIVFSLSAVSFAKMNGKTGSSGRITGTTHTPGTGMGSGTTHTPGTGMGTGTTHTPGTGMGSGTTHTPGTGMGSGMMGSATSK